MKTLKWMMLFMAVATMPLFTNCSKDDDDKTSADVSGIYTGKIANASGENDTTAELAKSDTNYSLSLKDLKISAMGGMDLAIGDVTIPNVTVSNGKLSGGNETSVEVSLPPALAGMNGGVADATFKVSLKSGNVSDNNLKFTLTIDNIPKMGSIDVNFNGNK